MTGFITKYICIKKLRQVNLFLKNFIIILRLAANDALHCTLLTVMRRIKTTYLSVLKFMHGISKIDTFGLCLLCANTKVNLVGIRATVLAHLYIAYSLDYDLTQIGHILQPHINLKNQTSSYRDDK